MLWLNWARLSTVENGHLFSASLRAEQKFRSASSRASWVRTLRSCSSSIRTWSWTFSAVRTLMAAWTEIKKKSYSLHDNCFPNKYFRAIHYIILRRKVFCIFYSIQKQKTTLAKSIYVSFSNTNNKFLLNYTVYTRYTSMAPWFPNSSLAINKWPILFDSNLPSSKALRNWKISVKAYQNDYGNFDNYNKTIISNYNC